MPKITLIGRVYPAALNITVSDIPKMDWRDDQRNFTVTIGALIQNGTVTVDCETTTKISPEIQGSIVMRAYDIARATIDLTAFTFGVGLTFLLDVVMDENGQQIPFVPHDAALASLSTAVNPPLEFGKVLPLVLTEPPLFFALRDLISAIAEFHRSTTSCARVIDGLRAIFVPSGGKKEDGWEPLRRNLNISRNYIEPIMHTSRGPRHGDSTYISGTIATDITRRTWIIVNRFLEYRKRGSTPLPESDFPTLA